MAQKPETVFITSVHKHLPPKPLLHREKMNNPYSSGTADVWYSGSKSDLWIEYKFLPRIPQRGSVKPLDLLTALQAEWLKGRHQEGRNVAVIIGCPAGGVLLRDRDWENEIPAKEFVSQLKSRPELGAWILAQTSQPTTR